jgi:hypothetical protein
MLIELYYSLENIWLTWKLRTTYIQNLPKDSLQHAFQEWTYGEETSWFGQQPFDITSPKSQAQDLTPSEKEHVTCEKAWWLSIPAWKNPRTSPSHCLVNKQLLPSPLFKAPWPTDWGTQFELLCMLVNLIVKLFPFTKVSATSWILCASSIENLIVINSLATLPKIV